MRPRYQLRLTLRFADELEQIYNYIAVQSAERARQVIAKIMYDVEQLRWFPHRTIVEDDNSEPPLRKLPVPPYLVFFRVDDTHRMVHVIRIRHGSREPESSQ